MKKNIQNKLGTYLAVTAGVGCVSSAANAAVVFYGNASNNNIQADPQGIGFGNSNGVRLLTYTAAFFAQGPGYTYFTSGSALNVVNATQGVLYFVSGFTSGASSGSQNYANISFNGEDGVFEAVGQFFFDGGGGGYLMAIATLNAIPNPQDLSGVGGPALSISAGKAMIDAAAIPEPSSLVLLALGATGLLARRQRKKAA